MSSSHPAIPAKPNQILSFPSQDQPVHWKDRFGRLHDQGKSTLLGFPFTTIENKQALLDLYEAVPVLLKDYPGVVDNFFESADIAFDVAEKSIEDERRRNAPGDPDQLIHFPQNTGGDCAKSQ